MTESSEKPNSTTPNADTTGDGAETTTEKSEATATAAAGEAEGKSLMGGGGEEAAGEAEETSGGEEEGANGEDDAPALLTADDLKFPEGFEVDEAKRDEFLSLLNEAQKGDLPMAEMAEKLIGLQHQTLQEAAEAASTAWREQQQAWEQKVVADYGDRLPQVQAAMGRVIDRFGGEEAGEVRQILATTGAGNNPALFNLFARVADALSEGGPVQSAPSATTESRASRIFPSMKG